MRIEVPNRTVGFDRHLQNSTNNLINRQEHRTFSMLSWQTTGARGMRPNTVRTLVLQRVAAANPPLPPNSTRGLTPGLRNPALGNVPGNVVPWPAVNVNQGRLRVGLGRVGGAQAVPLLVPVPAPPAPPPAPSPLSSSASASASEPASSSDESQSSEVRTEMIYHLSLLLTCPRKYRCASPEPEIAKLSLQKGSLVLEMQVDQKSASFKPPSLTLTTARKTRRHCRRVFSQLAHHQRLHGFDPQPARVGELVARLGRSLLEVKASMKRGKG